MGKPKFSSYSHTRKGDTIKIEIRDEGMMVVYRNSFNLRDKNAMMKIISILEGFSGYQIIDIIKLKYESGWF